MKCFDLSMQCGPAGDVARSETIPHWVYWAATELFGKPHMSTFDHAGLIKNINENLAPLRKAQPEALQAFGNLARAAMAEGVVSAKHKELIALAIGITQHCSGCIGFHIKALHKVQCTRAELEEMLSVCVYMGGGPALMYTAEAIKAWEDMAPQ
jgi:AhpD family alkylhydroperoxidase